MFEGSSTSQYGVDMRSGLYSNVVLSDIAVNSGVAVSRTVPMLEGCKLPHVTLRIDFAVRDLIDVLDDMPDRARLLFHNDGGTWTVPDGNETLCYLGLDVDAEMKEASERSGKDV